MVKPRAGRSSMFLKLAGGKQLLPQIAALILGLSLTACELTRFDPTLTSTVSGLTMDQLKMIQQDERLTTDEKLQQIREAIGVENTDEGNRIANFLLNLTIA
jgi:hypothetical protein